MDFSKYTDEEIIVLIRKDNSDATEYLLKKYAPLVKKSSRTLFLIGADTEDLLQEGMIGLFKAIQSYETDSDASFFTYAKICIDRQLYSAIKASNRKKHSPLNSYVSFYTQVGEDESELIDNLEAGKNSNPESIVLDREKNSAIEDMLTKQLSKFEQEVLHLYLDGKSHTDIGIALDKPVKSIDNAIQRIREKAKKIAQPT